MFHLIPDGCKIVFNFENINVFLKICLIKWHNLEKLSKLLLTLLCSVYFAIELSDLSKPFKFARLKGFERLENCLTKGTYERF